MTINVKGIVLKEYIVGESDKFITLFTAELGKIQVSAPFAKKYNKGLASGTQLFVYGNFSLNKYRDTYKLIWIEILSMFPKLQENLDAIYYASYFSEIVDVVSFEGISSLDLLQLLTYSLHHLSKHPEKAKLIRRIFELRALVLLGFMPQLYYCTDCGEELLLSDGQTYYFSPASGGVVCKQCDNTSLDQLGYSTLYTMQYIIGIPLKQVFYFDVEEKILKQLAYIMDHYMNYYIEATFKTLAFIEGIESI